MSVNFNAQQLQAIDAYREKNKLGYVVCDEEVFMQMQKNGELPECFSSLVTNPAPNSNQIKVQNINSDSNPSIFNFGQNQSVKTLDMNTFSPVGGGGIYDNNPTEDSTKIIKAQDGKEYILIGVSGDGSKIVKDANGKIQVLSADNVPLEDDLVKNEIVENAVRSDSKVAQETTLILMRAQSQNAQDAFQRQLAEDGWAGDVADGVSVLWGSDNRASVVRKDLKAYNKNIADLQNAMKKGDKAFNNKFKEIYGVEYNQDLMADYINNPTEQNYEKAFGTKNNIQQRVEEYNESQQKGAATVKAGASIAAGVAIGVATGGAGLVALGASAVATAGSSVAINASDRLSSEVGLKDGEMKEIIKDAAIEGGTVLAGGAVAKVAGTVVKGATQTAKIMKATANTVGDVSVGAAQEYAQTGEVTFAGTATNAAFGAVGIAAETGAFKKVKNLIVNDGSKAVAPANTNPSKSAVVPDAQTPAPTKISEQQTPPPARNTNISRFNSEIMGNKPAVEAVLKNADLTNPEVRDEYINMIAEQFPDFKRYPKKTQVLNQLQQLVSHPDYAKLSDANKTAAKLSILKNGGIEASDLYKAYKVPSSMKRRIADIDYCLQSDANRKAAAALYQDGDYATVKILNDIQSNPTIDAAGIVEMDGYVNQAQNNGHMMVKQSHIVNSNKIPTRQVVKNGQTYNVKVLDLSDKNVLANLEDYGFEAGTTADNLKLTVHMNSDFNKAPEMTIKRMMGSKELNLSATITDGTNSLYGHMQQGVVLDYNQGAVSYASNYAAGTGFVKNRQSFAADKLKESASSSDSFIKDRFKANMQQSGVEVSDSDYVELSNIFKGKKMTTNQVNAMFPDGKIHVNGKDFATDQVMKALDDSSNDLLSMSAEINGKKFAKGFNEVNIYNPEIKAIYIRANSESEQFEDLISEKLLKFAQDNNIAIIFQR